MEIWRLKDNGGHEFDLLGSRDVIGHVGRLPICGPWWPCIYLAPLRRYGASNI